MKNKKKVNSKVNSETKICPKCGNSFTPSHPWQQYCNDCRGE